MDSTGRAYSLPAHTLPSARGQGEPLTGKLNPPAGAEFIGVMLGEPEQLYILASDAGYGFVAKLGDLHGKNRAGKAALSLPKGSKSLIAKAVTDAGKRISCCYFQYRQSTDFPSERIYRSLPKVKVIK